MTDTFRSKTPGLSSAHAAAQYGPRPLPLFLQLLRSETAANDERRAAAMAGLAAYQCAPRTPAPPPAPAIASAGNTRLLDHGGSGPPVVLVPSLINPSAILDLAADRSLVRWLATQGVRPLLVDWGEPDDPAIDLAGLVETRLAPLIRTLGEPVTLVGYCLGGTLALAAAAMAPVARLALVAAPWRFAGMGDAARARIARLWADGRPVAEALGAVPMELLQAGFWALDPAATIGKYERFGRLSPDSEEARAFVALEDWANAGAALPFAAGRALFEDLVAADLSGRGAWRVGGRPVRPETIDIPVVAFTAARDRIVPAATSAAIGEQVPLGAGHVGMVVGSRRMALWQRLAAFGSGRQSGVKA